MTNNKNNNQSVNNSDLFDNIDEVFPGLFDDEELTDEQKVELYGFCW